MAQFVEFKLEDESFCVDIEKVKYIERFKDIVHIPNVPNYIEGIINIHGEVIAVYNLHQRFGLNQLNITDSTTLVIVDVNNLGIALIVDKILEIVNDSEFGFEQTPKLVLQSSKYISGVLKSDKKLIMILDIEKVINEAEQTDIAEFIASEIEQEQQNITA